MSPGQNERLKKVDSKLDLYQNQLVGHHDPISKLSDAIDLYRSNQKMEQLSIENRMEQRANHISIQLDSELVQSDAEHV